MMVLLLFVVFIAALKGQDQQTFENFSNKVIVSGLRVENINDHGFIGYTDAWETVVEPEVEVKVIFFGLLLHTVEYLLVTDHVCTQPEFNISRSSFRFQSSSSIEFKFKFPLWDKPWRFCIKHGGPKGDLRLIDDDRTWITTENVHKQESWIPKEVRIVLILFLLFFSALCSGLNLGLMNLSAEELNLIINSGSPTEIRYAKSILPIRKRGNQLLCSILLVNVMVNSAISILTEDLLSGIVSLIGSTTLIVVFGEIIPQSVCYKYGLAVGARTVWITRGFMLLTFPLAYPISKFLDCFLGETSVQFNRGRLVEMLRMQTENEKVGSTEFAEELKIVVGAMEFSSKTAGQAMTCIDDVFMLSEYDILDNQLVAEIVEKGYSRIPVFYKHDRNNVHALLHVRDLALIDKFSETTVRTIAEMNARELRMVDESTTLSKLLDEFKQGDYHLAMVYKTPKVARSTAESETSSSTSTSVLKTPPERLPSHFEPVFVGIITLEDIIEEILQSEILDEYDTVVDNVNRVKRQTSQGRVTELFCCEKKSKPLSHSVLTVVNSFLEQHCILFENSYMDQKVKEKFIQSNIRQAVLLPRERGAPPRTVTLLEGDVPTRRMLLLIEGKAKIVFKSGLNFTVDSWTFFGDALLEKIMKARQEKKSVPNSLSYTPDFDLIAEQTCKLLQIPVSTLLYSLRISSMIKNRTNVELDVPFGEDVVPTLRSRENRKSSLQLLTALLPTDEERNRSVSTVVPRAHCSNTSNPYF